MSGRGIVLRQIWDVRALLDSGAPMQVLPGVAQPANVWAVYPARLAASAKVRVCVDFLADGFGRMAWPAVFGVNSRYVTAVVSSGHAAEARRCMTACDERHPGT
ncbi:Positive regulator of Tartrate dehydrogenase/decarboxylase/D-malic enzyme [Burkholderia cepacia]|nr:Positive regulator of Tartrate dehydrogenase/decarboxylase/D-malic enzyme [Burkholderia cepacia]